MTLNLSNSGWERVSFGDVVANINDYFEPTRDGVLPYVAGPHIDPGSISPRFGSTSDADFPPTFKRKFRSGDVLLHSRGIEKIAAVDRIGVTGEKLFVLRTRDESRLIQRLLPFLLLGPAARTHMEANFTGSVNKFLNWRPVADFEFSLPPLPEQHRLADLLWSAENHRLALSALRDIAAATESRVYRVNADRVGTVADFVRAAKAGGTPSRKRGDFFGGSIPWLKSGEVVGDWITSTEESITEAGLVGSSATWIEPGSVLVAMYGDGGTRGQVARAGVRMTTNQAVLALTPDTSKVDPDFFYFWLQTRQESLRNRSAGAAQKNLSKGLVLDEEFPDVPISEQRSVVSTVKAIRGASAALAQEAAVLARFRLALIHRVFG